MVLITPRLVRALDPDEVPPLPTTAAGLPGAAGTGSAERPEEAQPPMRRQPSRFAAAATAAAEVTLRAAAASSGGVELSRRAAGSRSQSSRADVGLRQSGNGVRAMRRPCSDRVRSERGAMLIQVAVAMVGAARLRRARHRLRRAVGCAPPGAERRRRRGTGRGDFDGLRRTGRLRPRAGHGRGRRRTRIAVLRIPAERADDRHQRSRTPVPAGSPGAGIAGVRPRQRLPQRGARSAADVLRRLFGRTEQGVQATATAEDSRGQRSRVPASRGPWPIGGMRRRRSNCGTPWRPCSRTRAIDTDWNSDVHLQPGRRRIRAGDLDT